MKEREVFPIAYKLKNKPHYKNQEYIFLTQQGTIFNLIESLKDLEFVKRIIIFGSSVSSICNFWSDVDVLVELTEDLKIRDYIKYNREDRDIDMFTNYEIIESEQIYKNIKEEGVIVYER